MNKRIVVIEDDEDIRDIITADLEEQGFEVFGLAALTTLELLIALRPDCFVIDENLPHVSGHIICILLKSKPETRSIPVLLISGFNELEGRAGLCNAEAFLHKPFLAGELTAKVNGLVAGRLSKAS